MRALTTKDARGIAAPDLLALLRRTTDDEVRFAIGNALSVVATEREADEVEAILRDPASGNARMMLVHAVSRVQGSEAIPLIRSLLHDPDKGVANESIVALGNFRDVESREEIEILSHSNDSYVRNLARRALKKIEKGLEKRSVH